MTNFAAETHYRPAALIYDTYIYAEMRMNTFDAGGVAKTALCSSIQGALKF